MLLVQAGNDTVLAVASRPTTNLGMVFLEARRAALKVQETLAMAGR